MREAHTQQGRDVDHLLIGALVSGLPHSAAGERAGVSESTVIRRLADAEFQVRLIEAKNDVLDRLLGQSANAAMAATNYLLRVVIGEEPDTDAGTASVRQSHCGRDSIGSTLTSPEAAERVPIPPTDRSRHPGRLAGARRSLREDRPTRSYRARWAWGTRGAR